MKIFIDPGHGGVWPKGDPGVVTKDGQKIESYYTWMYGNALVDSLQKEGFKAFLTRNQNEYKIPYSQRTKNAQAEDLLISLHFDTYLGGKRLIYYGQQEGSLRLAENIDSFFKSGDLRASTSSRFGRLYIDDAKCPSVLVEVDRIDKATLDEEVMKAFCEDIIQGIKKFIGQEVEEIDNSGQIEEEDNPKINTSFKRVFFVTPENESEEIPVERMSVVGDKLYIAPEKSWFQRKGG